MRDHGDESPRLHRKELGRAKLVHEAAPFFPGRKEGSTMSTIKVLPIAYACMYVVPHSSCWREISGKPTISMMWCHRPPLGPNLFPLPTTLTSCGSKPAQTEYHGITLVFCPFPFAPVKRRIRCLNPVATQAEKHHVGSPKRMDPRRMDPLFFFADPIRCCSVCDAMV